MRPSFLSLKENNHSQGISSILTTGSIIVVASIFGGVFVASWYRKYAYHKIYQELSSNIVPLSPFDANE